MRQKNDLKFIDALNHLACGEMRQEDIDLLETRVIKREEIEFKVSQNCLRLFSSNKEVDDYNEYRIANTIGDLYHVTAEDKILSGKSSETEANKYLEQFQQKPRKDTQGIAKEIPIKLNIRYMITKNIDVSDGLANGTTGVLKHISFDDNKKPNILWCDFDSNKIGKFAKSKYLEYMIANDIDEKLVPICKTIITEFVNNGVFQIYRKQFPVTPAEATTVHKSQGSTYKEVCVDLEHCKNLQTSLVYVAYSRVTSLSGLYIINKVLIPPFKKSAALVEMERLREFKPMEFSFAKEIKGDELKLIYQNINSLFNKLKFISCDKWYTQADILLFSETYTKKKHTHLNIPGYINTFRLDSTNNHSGVMCYFSNEFYNRYGDVRVTCDVKFGGEHNSKYHVIFLHFKIANIHVISGYKSPRTSFSVFKEQLDEIFHKCVSSIDNQIIFLGDFNFDTIKSNSPLEQYLRTRFGLTKVLNDVTTINHTQIDTIFLKNIQRYHAGTYETFCSDHKPIFLGIDVKCCVDLNENIEVKNISHKRKTDTNTNPLPIKKNKVTSGISLDSVIDLDFSESANVGVDTIDLDLYEDSNVVVRSNEEIRLERFEKIKSEIRLSKCLTDDTMNYIADIINNFTNNEYKIQNTLILSNIPNEIIRVIDKNDVQFLFEPPENVCPVHIKRKKN